MGTVNIRSRGILFSYEDPEEVEITQVDVTPPGATPAAEVNDRCTREVCAICGRSPTNKSDWQAGVDHVLERLEFQIGRHVAQDLAQAIVAKLRSDDVEL